MVGNKKDPIRHYIKQDWTSSQHYSAAISDGVLLVYAWFIALYMSPNYTQFPSNNLYTGGFKDILQKSSSFRKYRVLKLME